MKGNLLEILTELDSTVAKTRNDINKEQAETISEEVDLQTKSGLDDKNRGNLTYVFVIGFFLLLSLSALFVLWYNSQAVGWIIKLNSNGLGEIAKNITLLDLGAVLSVLIGALGTSLGFIIGYYFKEKKG
ncbi:hypothetical protein [Providencia stuartii]|uniref:hypothetical protein n=1 Tax=Providencia stuartii TaxID=588 RepID=UPI0024C988FB|nr:hypothetical protein [Providencia stuartii]MDN7225332.1 hypothetical protein [Providencia stuartii]WAZ79869.1 hypothetical protein O4001_06670 [Providencia stuartii]WAZ82906.1 hypothetical protein O4002_00790 [Providencia stuartii]